MQSIDKYIKERKSVYDCHVHLFGRDGIVEYPEYCNTLFVFVTNSLKYKDEPLLPYYKDFIENKIIFTTHYLGGIGKDIKETKELMEIYGKDINFIGEVKCYKHYIDSEDKEHTYYDTDLLYWAIGNNPYNLPIFLHWDLDGKRDEELYNIIKDNPKTRFVLCHCGINDLDCPDDAYTQAIKMQTKLPNLWLEISWVALDYVVADSNRLSKIEVMDHTLLGTDFSQDDKYNKVNFKDVYSKFRKLCNEFNMEQNVRLLFTK